jgi:secreted trypsin-like serine protease
VCGSELVVEQTEKIVGGRECRTPNGTVVKLLLFDEEDNQTICSGVRLNSSTVLTAAHCLNEFVFSVSVELSSGERITPTKITLHPEAADLGSLFINDLALLTISPPDGETPPPVVPIARRITAGDELTILGYGATDGANSAGSGVLRIGVMRANDITTDSIFSDYTPPAVSNTCFGDSGGPAFIEDGSGGLSLVGITSTGTNVMCAAGDRSAFTNLTNQELRAFIEEQM